MHFARSLAARFSLTLASSMVGLTLLSCGGSSDSTGPPTGVAVATVQLSSPSNTLTVTQTVQLTAATKDASGNVLTGRAVSWSSSSTVIATVSQTGLVTGVAPGPVTIFATSENKSGSTPLTVTTIPVNAVTVTPPMDSILVTQTIQLVAATADAGGHTLTGRTIAWNSATPAVATVSAAGLVTAVAVGTTNISATSEGKADTAVITVSTCGTPLQLALGDVHTLTVAEKASLCIGGGASASEYVLVPFSNSTVASSTTPVHLTATNTSAVLAPLASRQSSSANGFGTPHGAFTGQSLEPEFRARERQELSSRIASLQSAPQAPMHGPLSTYLTGVASLPTVGSVIQLNANLTGGGCDAKVLHPAKVIAVLAHTIVVSDTLSPTGNYTDAEMTAFGQAFDTLGYALDTLNFGAPTDIDGNGRIAIFFTPGVNAIPGPPGGYVLGLQASRDLLPVASCAGSNEGEMFYMPVPDPNQTINGNYTSETALANTVLTTIVHEFQHLINAGRRIYVSHSTLEEVWLNEGLSHIAEELLYYRVSGNAPKSNINLALLQSSQPQLDAANTYIVQNFLRLQTYMLAPETNSPFAQVDGLQMRGAIWELLRYSQDRKGGTERSAWYSLVNTSTTGQTNFNAVFGNIITMAHDWSIAQVADDASLGVAAIYTNPSWNFRSLMPPINGGTFPLLTHSLVGTAVDVSLSGGGSAYVRFRVGANTVAHVVATSSSQPVPSSVDVTLVRTQ